MQQGCCCGGEAIKKTLHVNSPHLLGFAGVCNNRNHIASERRSERVKTRSNPVKIKSLAVPTDLTCLDSQGSATTDTALPPSAAASGSSLLASRPASTTVAPGCAARRFARQLPMPPLAPKMRYTVLCGMACVEMRYAAVWDCTCRSALQRALFYRRSTDWYVDNALVSRKRYTTQESQESGGSWAHSNAPGGAPGAAPLA